MPRGENLVDRREGELAAQITGEWRGAPAATTGERCVHELVEEQAARVPDRVALVFGEDTLTYRELDAQSNALASHLRAVGVGPDVPVGICLERSLTMVVGLLAILKAGGAYLPLDPELPEERLAFMLADAQAPVILTNASGAVRLPASRARLVDVDHWERSAQLPASPQVAGVRPHNLAYIIYTSGSTGRPKGVEIEHRSVVNFLQALVGQIGLTERDIVPAVSPVSFDMSVVELFGALTAGACVHLISRVASRDGFALAGLIADSHATFLHVTPTTFQMLVAAGWQGDPQVALMSGGEQLTDSLAQALMTRGRCLWNVYGPTETTVCATIDNVTSAAGQVTIGRPFANYQVYILDERRQALSVGVAGELYIGGAGLARGYLNRPELTSERFVENPFGPGRLYRTGDAAGWLPDGRIEFLGRLDNQVKIRGYRIELGEIEGCLAAHPGVAACAVLAREDAPGDKRLVAYVVARPHQPVAADELRAFLKERLPDYMVPAAFVSLDALPMTPSGKVDRRALPKPELRRDTEAGYLAPRTMLEAQLVQIWEEVLDIHPIGVRDNFFDLGGDSLMVVDMFAWLEERLGHQMSMVTLVQAPTVELLARAIEAYDWRSNWSSLVDIQPMGSKPPFYCVHEVDGNAFYYRDLALSLGFDQPFYGLQAQGLDGKTEPQHCIEDMAAHYVQEILSFQPRDPYYLGGSSFGGLVAFEMARQLVQQGRQVGLLALFDAESPGYLKLLKMPLRRRMVQHTEILGQGSLASRTRYLLGRVHAHYQTSWRPDLVMAWLRRRTDRTLIRLYPRVGRPLPRRLREMRVREAALAAVDIYEPQPYPGKVVFFRAEGERQHRYHDPCLDPASIIAAGFLSKDTDPSVVEGFARLGWGSLAAGGLEIHEVSGAHAFMVRGTHARPLAEVLRGCLERARDQNADG